MNTSVEKEVLETLQNEEIIVAYCCCANKKTRNLGNSNTSTDPFSTSGC